MFSSPLFLTSSVLEAYSFVLPPFWHVSCKNPENVEIQTASPCSYDSPNSNLINPALIKGAPGKKLKWKLQVNERSPAKTKDPLVEGNHRMRKKTSRCRKLNTKRVNSALNFSRVYSIDLALRAFKMWNTNASSFAWKARCTPEILLRVAVKLFGLNWNVCSRETTGL